MGNDHCRKWRGEAKRLGGLEIYHQLKLRRLENREIDRSSAFEYSRDVNSGLSEDIDKASAITNQAADGNKLAAIINRRQRIASGQGDDALRMIPEKYTTGDEERD